MIRETLHSGRFLSLALFFLLALGGLGCATRALRSLTPPEAVRSLDKRSPFLKAHMKDGQAYVLSQWQVDEAAAVVSGTGEQFDAQRRSVARGPVQLRLAEVALFETNVMQTSPPVRALAVVTGLSAAVTGYCLANPKACFGSCPTFYVSDGAQPVLQAEGFSDSVAPSLEATDVDALFRARPKGGELQVRMTNEALETHVVRYVNLLAAPRPAGSRVLAGAAGEFWRASELRAPVACSGAEGDCLSTLRELDGRERYRTTDPEDLGHRETVELDFEAGRPGRFGVVVAARQSLLSTYLFYQGLSYMGRSATHWLARMEQGDAGLRRRAQGLRRALGGIEVLRLHGGRWVSAGELHETGPLASDVKVVPLPGVMQGPVRLRLRLTQGHWRLDQVGLARLEETVQPVRLTPTVVRAAGKEPRTLEEAEIAHGLVTVPGDEYVFTFRVPEGEPELFLETRGYYLEWIRDEWLAEEDPARLAGLFRNPRAALRSLAPAFKRQEAQMEDLFWRSRYAHP